MKKKCSPAGDAGLLEGAKPKLNRHNNIRPHQPPQVTITISTPSRIIPRCRVSRQLGTSAPEAGARWCQQDFKKSNLPRTPHPSMRGEHCERPESENWHRGRLEMPLLDEMFPSKYLSSADVKAAGGAIVDTIESIRMEEMTSHRGLKELKPVAYLRNNKPLVLNKTNATRLANYLNSKNSEDWLGAQIKIGVEQVQAIGGGITNGVRIQGARKVGSRGAAPTQPAPPPPAPAAAPAPQPTQPNDGWGGAAAPAPAHDFDDEIPW